MKHEADRICINAPSSGKPWPVSGDLVPMLYINPSLFPSLTLTALLYIVNKISLLLHRPTTKSRQKLHENAQTLIPEEDRPKENIKEPVA